MACAYAGRSAPNFASQVAARTAKNARISDRYQPRWSAGLSSIRRITGQVGSCRSTTMCASCSRSRSGVGRGRRPQPDHDVPIAAGRPGPPAVTVGERDRAASSVGPPGILVQERILIGQTGTVLTNRGKCRRPGGRRTSARAGGRPPRRAAARARSPPRCPAAVAPTVEPARRSSTSRPERHPRRPFVQSCRCGSHLANDRRIS